MVDIDKEYFEWLSDIVAHDLYSGDITYHQLLTRLHQIKFRYILPMDENRSEDGKDLRYRYLLEYGYHNEPMNGEECTVLEMLVALALRCEETIMDDASIGNRTKQWFWSMINNLGLGGMMDGQYDESKVDYCINRFLNREYASDGTGGLFTIHDCSFNLRDMEIWTQLNWYLSKFI